MLRDMATIGSGIYFLPKDPVAAEILIPGFQEAVAVKGAFGWFTADWINRLAPGLAQYLARDDTDPIRFTVAPTFFRAEYEAAERGVAMEPELAAKRIADLFVKDREKVSALCSHALDCFAWMIAADRLRLRIAVPELDSNYHPKMWLFDDGRDQVLAHGSANATGHGLLSGNEHISVEVSWSSEGKKKIHKSRDVMDDWSEGNSPGIRMVVDLPHAMREKIVQVAPQQPPSPAEYQTALRLDRSPAWAVDSPQAIRARFQKTLFVGSPPELSIPPWLKWQEGKYAHQGKAVDAWEATGEPQRGTLAMATGAGKTLTSLICATRLQDRLGSGPFLIVISAPSLPLVKQWREEVEKFGVQAIAPSIEPDKKASLTKVFRGFGAGGTQVVIVTNNLLSKRAFQENLSHQINRHEVTSMLIGDEAHTLGAQGFRTNTPEFFQYRLALSATPIRQYDPDGTEHIFEFFGPTVFEFGLDQAIGLCLVPYDYYVHAATLDSEEVESFQELTASIINAMARREDEDEAGDELLKRLLIKRRRIIETTKAKIPLLREVLEERNPRALEYALIYASAKNPEQFDEIGRILDELDIRWAPVTQDTTKSPTILAEIFDVFSNGGYQVLLAKKVLDEGVDIPSIREAFIVASSTVEREWIQRRGRVLRTDHAKNFAVVHDFLGLPPQGLMPARDESLGGLVRRELGRALAFAEHSRNALGAEGVVTQVQDIRSAYWPSGVRNMKLDKPGSSVIAASTPRGKLC